MVASRQSLLIDHDSFCGTDASHRPSVGDDTSMNDCDLLSEHDVDAASGVPLMANIRFSPWIISLFVWGFKTFDSACLVLPVAGF